MSRETPPTLAELTRMLKAYDSNMARLFNVDGAVLVLGFNGLNVH